MADEVVLINNENVYKRLNKKRGKPQIELWLQAGLAQQRALNSLIFITAIKGTKCKYLRSESNPLMFHASPA